MNGHDEYLELLAASIDFGLTEEEVARLNYHLASCPECRRAATELRGQNAVVATTPNAPLAPARLARDRRRFERDPADPLRQVNPRGWETPIGCSRIGGRGAGPLRFAIGPDGPCSGRGRGNRTGTVTRRAVPGMLTG